MAQIGVEITIEIDCRSRYVDAQTVRYSEKLGSYMSILFNVSIRQYFIACVTPLVLYNPQCRFYTEATNCT